MMTCDIIKRCFLNDNYPQVLFKDMVVYEPEPECPKQRFSVYGIITAEEFQMSKSYVEKLHNVFPHEYDVPTISPLSDMDWNLFLTRIRREISGERLWSLRKRVFIFTNCDIIGDDDDLLHYVSVRYKMALQKDFSKIGLKQFTHYIEQQRDNCNEFVYFTISIDKWAVGTMLFEVYLKDVPRLAEIFINLCSRETEGYTGQTIQRIVRPFWIQCGGWHTNRHKVPCENYMYPHNKRGVLAMCNNGRHEDNNTQFLISLAPNPFMNRNYVVIGHLLHGDDVLTKIENISTRYEEPMNEITIIKSGIYNFYSRFDQKDIENLDVYLCNINDDNLHDDVSDLRDPPTVLLRHKYLKQYYATDRLSCLSLLQIPSCMRICESQLGEEASDICDPDTCFVCDPATCSGIISITSQPSSVSTRKGTLKDEDISQEFKTADLLPMNKDHKIEKLEKDQKVLEPDSRKQKDEHNIVKSVSWCADVCRRNTRTARINSSSSSSSDLNYKCLGSNPKIVN